VYVQLGAVVMVLVALPVFVAGNSQGRADRARIQEQGSSRHPVPRLRDVSVIGEGLLTRYP
jgi:hypothetical protein